MIYIGSDQCVIYKIKDFSSNWINLGTFSAWGSNVQPFCGLSYLDNTLYIFSTDSENKHGTILTIIENP